MQQVLEVGHNRSIIVKKCFARTFEMFLSRICVTKITSAAVLGLRTVTVTGQ